MLSILLCLPLFTLSASADMGPKPSVEISFEGLEDETYYVTLLGTSKSGPWDSNQEYYEDDPYWLISQINLILFRIKMVTIF